MGLTVQISDWRGTPITVGSKVVYPYREGSSMWVREGVVDNITHMTDVRGFECDVVAIVHPPNTRRSYPQKDRLTVVN